MKQIVIIGAGPAGITAATELRKLHPATELAVTIITREVPPDYSRIRLPEFVAGTLAAEQLVIHNAAWFVSNSFTVIAPAEVEHIDREHKTLQVLQSGSTVTVPYDVLIIAAGSSPFTPGMPDSTSPAAGSVFALRTLEDAVKIKERIAAHSRSAAVLGGGLLGLEAARALKTAGTEQVHVIETAGRLLPRQLDSAASELLRTYLESEGLIIHTGASVDTAGFAGGTVAQVLENVCGPGVETALYSMGIRSNVSLAKDAGITCNRGIVINEETATNDPDIFAAGDCAEFDGVTWGIVPAALEQGKAAAGFAARRLFPQDSPPQPYRQTVPRTTLHIGSKEAVSAGNAVLTPEQENSGTWTIRARTLEDGTYLRLVVETESNLLSGALVFGNEGVARNWLVKLQTTVGKPCPAAWFELK